MSERTHRTAADVIADETLTLEAKREILARWRRDAQAARQESAEPDPAHDEHLAEVERALSHLEQDWA